MFEIELSVVPKSSCNKIIQEDKGLKIKITSPPVDGAANKHIIAFLSKEFRCPKTSIELVSGDKSKKKRFRLHNIDPKEGAMILEKIIGEK